MPVLAEYNDNKSQVSPVNRNYWTICKFCTCHDFALHFLRLSKRNMEKMPKEG